MEDMSRVQEKAKHERQNDDYATANTHQNSSSLNDTAHHIRRRLSQTITSRHCLLIAIALASLSAHACDDTVELQVTCDSGKTTWVVPSHITQTDNTIETNPQMVTVGSCIEGRVADIAQVKDSDIDTNGIVICSQTNVCYHLKWSSDDQIEAKNCNGYGDPICNYICDGELFTRKGDSKSDDTAREKIKDNIICDDSTDKAYTYECEDNIVRKTPCPNGCADNYKGCKQDPDLTDKCTPNDTPICEGKMIKICKDQKWESTGKRSTCQDANDFSIMYECQDSGEAPTQTTCQLGCDENGEQCADADQKVSCKEELTGITSSTGATGTECQYCYNGDVKNIPTSIEKLGCDGCVPNQYERVNFIGPLISTMNSICYNGKKSKFDEIENRNFLFIPPSNKNVLWEFALNVTPALSKLQSQKSPKPTWQYYNCHNNDAMKLLTANTKIHNADNFLELLNNSNKCCDDENSYYITQTGYRYYSVEKCTNIALYDTNKSASIATKFSAYAYTPELNGSLIGVEDDLLAKDYACLEVRDNPEDTNDVRHMMFIKQQPDGKSNYGIYKAFECPEKYKCDLKNRYKGLCISENENVPSNSDCSCNNNTIMCGSDIIAACPEGTTPSIVGDSGQSSCDGQIFSLDQIRCVPEGKSTAKQ